MINCEPVENRSNMWRFKSVEMLNESRFSYGQEFIWMYVWEELYLEKCRYFFSFSSYLCIMQITVHKCSAALFTAETNETLKAPPAGREWICVSFSSSSVSLHSDIFYAHSSFTKLKSDHSGFASNLEIIPSDLNKKLLMLQTKPYFVYMKKFILFVLFIWFGAYLKISI